MPVVDVTIFNSSADEPGGTDLIIQATGAAATGQASAPSAQQQSNNVSAIVSGASALGRAQPTLTGVGTQVFPKIAFPRIANRAYTEDNAVGAAERALLALGDVCTLGMFANGAWDRGDTGYLTRKEVIQDLLARNPNLTIFDYTNCMEASDGGSMAAIIDAGQGPGGTDWWVWKRANLYPSDPINNRVTTYASAVGASYWVNLTSFTTPQGGLRYPQIYGNSRLEAMYDPVLSAGDVPAGPGGYNIFMDNAFIRARSSNSDINGNDINDNARSNYLPGQTPPHDAEGVAAWTAWRQGELDYVAHMKGAYNEMLALVNSADWSREVSSYAAFRDFPVEWDQVFDGGWVEQLVGGTFPLSRVYSDGTVNPVAFGSFRTAYFSYVYCMEHLTGPRIALCDCHIDMEQAGYEPVDVNRSPVRNDRIYPAYPDSGPFNLCRWAMGMALLHDGYIQIAGSESHGQYGHSPQFDEYGTVSQGVTGLSPHWLGEAVDPPQLAPWSGTIWRRRFQNGVIYLNESLFNNALLSCVDTTPGTGEVLTGTVKKISGVQDPVHNDGSTLVAGGPGDPTYYYIDPIDCWILQYV